jgi:hypothetical protein
VSLDLADVVRDELTIPKNQIEEQPEILRTEDFSPSIGAIQRSPARCRHLPTSLEGSGNLTLPQRWWAQWWALLLNPTAQIARLPYEQHVAAESGLLRTFGRNHAGTHAPQQVLAMALIIVSRGESHRRAHRPNTGHRPIV